MTTPKSKTDQTGAKATHEKHVFANPLMLEICTVLALAILFCNNNAELRKRIEHPNLFDGGEQSLWFSKILKSVMTEEELRDLITDLRDQGTHGIRKEQAAFFPMHQLLDHLCNSVTTAELGRGRVVCRATFLAKRQGTASPVVFRRGASEFCSICYQLSRFCVRLRGSPSSF